MNKQHSNGGENAPSNKKALYRVVCIVCVVIFLAALGFLIRYLAIRQSANDAYASLQSASSVAEPEESQSDASAQEVLELEEEMKREIDFADLQANTNEDIYAWISIPDTNIDYPIVQHPTDDTYYLNYNLDGTAGLPGTIYTEKANAKDFSDFNTVIYGHNMQNGTMFQNLHNYSDGTFFEEHPYVYIYLEDFTLKYQVYAAYEYSDVHMLYAFDYSTEEGRQEFLDEIAGLRSLSYIYDEEVTVTTGSNVITLSTCVHNVPEKRFLVNAVLIQSVERSDLAAS
ncbi:MAG: class B sortase [Clostridiales bacterium]|nr:class B sortase [Clostridiales bacterium]